jgi:hypothetical protein
MAVTDIGSPKRIVAACTAARAGKPLAMSRRSRTPTTAKCSEDSEAHDEQFNVPDQAPGNRPPPTPGRTHRLLCRRSRRRSASARSTTPRFCLGIESCPEHGNR